MKNQLNWGILGTAKIAEKSLIPAFHASKLNNLMAVASRSITKAQEFALSNEIPQTADSYEALLDDKAIDAVYIPLPNSLHHPWTIAALQAGKHVLCEKPMALNAEQARQMVSLAEESKLVLMEAYMYRYHPRMDKILGLIQKGELGELRFIHSAFTFNLTNPDNIRLAPDLGGGALMDVGCYCVDISRILVACAAIANALGVDISDLPAAGAAPEWMSEKAVSIGSYVVSSGVFTVLGTVPQVLGSPAVTKLLTSDAQGVVGATFAVEVDPFKAARLMVDHILEKRAALGI